MQQNKDPEPTYQEVFDRHLQIYERDHPQNFQEQETKRSYCLYEDLKLITALATIQEIHNKDFRDLEVKKVVNRTHYSIRDRFRYFLQKLKQSDLEKIVNHLGKHGAQGYLLFSPSQIDKEFVGISLQDPKISTAQQERKINNEQTPHPHKKLRTNENIPILKETSEQKEQTQIQTRIIKPKQRDNNKDSTFPKNEKDKFHLDQLDQMLDLISQWKKVPKAVLVVKLHQLSANLPDLDDYFMTMDEKYCWLEEEDMLLAQARNPQSVEIKLLVKQKGNERVKRRIKYLHLNFPFEVE